jgi:hypothetical protein
MTSPEPIEAQIVYVEGTRYQTSTTTKVIAVVAAIITAGYMLPWAIAALRDLRTHVSVGLVNLLLGWTIIGWIVALVMSLRRLRPDEG